MANISAHDKEKQLNETEERQVKKHFSVRKAIPNIASAIKTVVSLSNNENFKAECFTLVKVKDENEFHKALKKRLWKIATSKLNVKPCGDGERQAFQNDVPYEDYFDDLAGDITFYEDLCSQEENGHFDHDAKDAADLSTCGRPLLLSEVQQVREQRPSVMVQELPCFVKQVARGKRHNHSYYRCNAKSPKAKLRCCESALTTINRKSASTNAWLEDLTPDVFWMDNDKTPSSQGVTDEDHDTFLGCSKKSQSLSVNESTISKH